MILSFRMPVARAVRKIGVRWFSKDNQSTKVQTIGFNKNQVRDFTKIAYESDQKMQFINGKCLIYQNNRTIINSLVQMSVYYIPMIGIGYLIYSNPFANTFPAAIPLLGVVELAILKLWLNRIRRNHYILGKVYLLENGQTTQIWYANKNKRKWFGEELNKVYYNSIFVDPNYEKQQIVLFNKDGKIFPTSIKQAQAQGPKGFWLKYFSNGQNYLVISKNPTYMNLKVLIQIFKGKIIKNKKS